VCEASDPQYNNSVLALGARRLASEVAAGNNDCG